MKFSIRDLLLVTALVAVTLGCCLHAAKMRAQAEKRFVLLAPLEFHRNPPNSQAPASIRPSHDAGLFPALAGRMGGMEGYLIFAGAITLTVLGFVISLFLSPERRGTVWQEIVRQRATIILIVCGVLLLAAYLLLGMLRT